MKWKVDIEKKDGKVVPFEDLIEAADEQEARHKFMLQALAFDAGSGYTGPAIDAKALKTIFDDFDASIGVTGFRICAVSEPMHAATGTAAPGATETSTVDIDTLVDRAVEKANSDSGRGSKRKTSSGDADFDKYIDQKAQEANEAAGR
jgi:hypothetical protein